MAQKRLSYLALGDSYTIGEAVKETERWPVVLTKKLNELGANVYLEKVVATTGWTTGELLSAIAEDEQLAKSNFELVSLLIGVNNQYRGLPFKIYKKEFETLLKRAISLAGDKAERVFVVSIPDYGVTPFAKEHGKDATQVSKELFKYNTLAREIALKYSVKFYDITPLSLKAMYAPGTFLAEDQLHPSAKMYEEWVDYMLSGVNRQLN